MKVSKLLIVCAAALSTMMFAVGVSQAVQGWCHDCHTMHNSELGVTMDGDPTNYLINRPGGCLGCHEGTGAESFDSVNNAPLVSHTGLPKYTPDGQGRGTVMTDEGEILSGGSFWWVKTDERKGHNVYDVENAGTPIWTGNALGNVSGGTVPGGDAGYWTGRNFTCQTDGGGTGCHAKGGHHTNINPGGSASIDGSGVVSNAKAGASFRFLASSDDGAGVITGVSGYEDDDYNWTVNTAASGSYNVYKGDTSHTSGATDTMTALCKRCHGAFHGSGAAITDGSGSPWLLHPTDITLQSSIIGEYDAYDDKGYNMGVPVASTDISGVDGTITPGTDDIVTCLSCHFAHGGPYDYLIRWDYEGEMLAHQSADLGDQVNFTAGCFYCHDTKDDVPSGP